MGYTTTKRPRPSAMGDIASSIGNALSQLSGAVSAVAGVASDPYGQELACRVRQVVALETSTTVPACASVPLATKSPAGLRRPIIGLRGYVYAEQHPWAYPVGIATIVGVPLLIGYMLGRK